MSDLKLLIERCKRKERKAQQILYEKYASILFGICMRYAHDMAEAEDMLQEGFLKIFLNIKDYSGKGSFEGWMKRVIVNTAITWYNKNKKQHEFDDIDEVNDQDAQDHITPDTELNVKELYELIKKMPEGYQLVFNLYAIEGYKHKEIAEKLNIDTNTSKTQYLRARNWIVKEMKKMGTQEDE